MKSRIKLVFVIGCFFPLIAFAEEAEIILPEVTTYVTKSVEQKIVVTAEDIQDGHYEDLSDVIEQSGIQNLAYGPYGLENKPSIRGFTDETVRVVIDGICVNNAQYGTFDFSTVNLDFVERIEIVRGGFTEGVEDEGAVGGVIYITTKKLELENTLQAEASVKTYFNKNRPLDSYFQKLNYAFRLGESTFASGGLSGNFADNRFLFKTDDYSFLESGAFGAAFSGAGSGSGEWNERENAQVWDAQANTAVTHYFGNGNYFSFGDIFYGAYKNTPGVVNSTDAGIQQDYDNNFTFSLWNPALGGLFNLKNSLAWLCNNRLYDSESENSRHYINTIKYSGSADFYSLFGGRLRQTLGLSGDFTHLDSSNDGNHIQFSGVIKETSKFAAGGGWNFSLPLAVKFCANDQNVNFAFVPKAGAAWEAGLFTFTGDLYRMVQFPNMDDLFWEGGGFHGNPNLKPESGWGADLGVAFKGSQTSASLTVFSNYYKDKIQWSNGQGSYLATTQNLSSAFYLGVDFAASANFLNRLINLSVNGEYLYNRLLDKSNKYTYGKRIMWTPDLVFNLTCDFNFELAKLSLSASYTGRRYTSNMNIYCLEPYLLLNAAAEGAAIKGRFTPYIKAENLLNWQYQAVDGYPMPGISLTVGARYKFF
ncbi:MAG: TonB-dependent receptor [Treponema sp.]|nr:TonB-dependent receptor [Treponema sp.]